MAIMTKGMTGRQTNVAVEWATLRVIEAALTFVGENSHVGVAFKGIVACAANNLLHDAYDSKEDELYAAYSLLDKALEENRDREEDLNVALCALDEMIEEKRDAQLAYEAEINDLKQKLKLAEAEAVA